VLKSAAEIAAMREAGRVVARTLAAVAAAAPPGVRLIDLDGLAAEMIADAGAKPSFLDYHPSWAPSPYPAVLCLSVNEAIVHGIPDRRLLAAGDLLSIDCGAQVDGYHGDAALTAACHCARV
jgi:methionyl aminopeptidase